MGTGLFGNNRSEFASAHFCAGSLRHFSVYRLTANLFGKSAAFRAVLLLAALPLFFAFGFFMTPDSPLIACWAVGDSLLGAGAAGGNVPRLVGLGSAGTCCLSKYTIVLLGPATLLFLFWDRPSRHWLETRTVRCSVPGAD